MRARRSFGFTLLELLVVVAIIAVLATLILGGLASARRRTQIAVARNNIAAIKAALQMYETDMGRYPCRPLRASMSGNQLFQNDITLVYAALRNRRTLKYGGGPNSPYLEWKPEQIGKIDAGTISAYDFGHDQDPNNSSSPTNQIEKNNAGQNLPTEEYDQINVASYQDTVCPPSTGAATGTQLCFLDPWGNPYVYVEWASIPQATKDGLTGTDTTGPVSFTPTFAGSGTGGSGPVYLHPHDPSKFDIYSFGPNGVNEGGQGDDITSWSTTTKR